MSGASLAYDHHSLRRGLSDQATTAQVQQIFKTISPTHSKYLDVSTYQGAVLLYGRTQNPSIIPNIIRRVWSLKPARVVNQIKIGPPLSSSTHIHDSWLTTKVKANLFRTQGIDHSKIKVITNNGTVYLMGRLTKREAYIAVNIATRTSGVRRVVKVIQLLQVIN